MHVRTEEDDETDDAFMDEDEDEDAGDGDDDTDLPDPDNDDTVFNDHIDDEPGPGIAVRNVLVQS
jgi:hypothetical protein